MNHSIRLPPITRQGYLISLLLCLIVLFSGIYSCKSSSVPALNQSGLTDTPEYLTDNVGWEENTDDAYTANDINRIAAISGKLTLEFMNNETELFRPMVWDVRLWLVDGAADPSRAFLDALGSDKYDKPTYKVSKSGTRSYTRKTVSAGWYLAEFDGSGRYFKFQVTPGSDGLLIYNEHNFSSALSGYFAQFGKIKAGWASKPSMNTNTVVEFLKANAPYENVWLYAEDGMGVSRGQFWFWPVGSYTIRYNLTGSTVDVPVNIAVGKVYPYVKFK